MELMAWRLTKLGSLGLSLYITEFSWPTGYAPDGSLANTMNQVCWPFSVSSVSG